MLVEIHMLQNHAPSNLNRDDTGSPKECTFGGVKRGRISSQCLKRSIRRSPVFRGALADQALGMRTRRLPELVKNRLVEMGVAADLAAVAASKATGFGTKEGKEREDDGNTAQTMFLTTNDVEAVVTVLHRAATEAGSAKAMEKIKAKDLQEAAELRNWRPLTLDIALFGRMITSPAFQDVQGAIQVSHALSANKVDHEFDYFTAVDDLQGDNADDDKGADMIGDVEFNSACYYKYFSIDVDGLAANLAGTRPGAKATESQQRDYDQTLAEARSLASRTVAAFLKAAIFTTPSGKQNTFAAHQLPDAVLIEVRPQKIPISYANAFVKPARVNGEQDLVDESIRKFVEHVDLLTHRFSLGSLGRLWFSTREQKAPSDGKHPVTACETVDKLLEGLNELTAVAGGQHA